MVADIADAIAAGAPLVWPAAAGNVACVAHHGDAAAADAAFARASHVVELEIVNQRLAPSPIEPRATLASFDPQTQRITLRTSCQTPTGLRDELCNAARPASRSGAGAGRRHRRRLWHEDDAVCGGRGRRPLRAGAAAAGQVDRRTHGGIPVRHARPRCRLHRVARARCARAHPCVARALAGEPRRLRDAGWRRDPAADRPVGIDRRLRHRHHRRAHRRHPHQHDSDRALSRSRSPRGDLHDRTPARRGGAADRARPDRAAPAQHDPARADALHERHGQDLRQRPVRAGAGPRPGARRLDGLRRARRGVEATRPVARAGHRHLRGMDRGRCVRRARDGDRARRRDRDLLGDAGDGPEPRDHVRAARRRCLRRVHRKNTPGVRGYRPRHRLRQRGLAIAVRRRLRGACGLRAHGAEGARTRGGRTRGGGGRHRVPRRRVPHRGNRSRDFAVRPCPQAAGRAHRARIRQRGGRCHVAERLPRMRGGDRSGHRGDRGRRILVGQRCRTGGQPDGGRGPARRWRGAGHGPGAVRAGRVRPRLRPAVDWHIPRLRAAPCGHDPALRHDDRRVHALPQQRARRQGRGGTRHDRRDARGGERHRRRAGAPRRRRTASKRCRCLSPRRRCGGRWRAAIPIDRRNPRRDPD